MNQSVLIFKMPSPSINEKITDQEALAIQPALGQPSSNGYVLQEQISQSH